MTTIKTEDEGGSPIPEARYFEHAPEFHVGSWSPTPAGQVHPREKPTQVHLRFGTPPGPCSLVRFKSARVVDLLIDALVEHREYVELQCKGCQHQVLGLKPMFEAATSNAKAAGAELLVLCRQCAETQQGLPLQLQDAVAEAGNGGGIIVEVVMKPPRGGDA